MKLMNVLSIFSVLIITLSCSAEKQEIPRIKFKIPNTETKQRAHSDFVWSDKRLNTNACGFLKEKQSHELIQLGKSPKSFQLFDSIYINQQRDLFGTHSISKLPQILFTLSAEGSQDNKPLYRSYTRWEFYKLALQKMCPAIPSHCIHVHKKDHLWASKHQIESEILKIKANLDKISTEQKHARASKNSSDLVRLKNLTREFKDLLSHYQNEVEILESKISTTNNQIKSSAKKIRRHGLESEKLALQNIEQITSALHYWDNKVIDYVSDVRVKFTQSRNSNIQSSIQTSAPGILNGEAGPLENAELYKSYVRFLKLVFPYDSNEVISKNIAANLETLRPLLIDQYHLFGEESLPTTWVNTELDLSNSLYLISQTPTDLLDATCKFLISQRFLAQMILIKGIRQTPALNKDGQFLEPLSNDPLHSVSHVDIPGAFGVIADEAWIQKNLSVQSYDIPPLPLGIIDEGTGAPKPNEFFSWLKAMATITSYANHNFWLKDAFAPGPEELIPLSLLKLSFGFLATGLQSLEPHFIRRFERIRITLVPENSAESFATLISTTVKSLRSFEELYAFHQVEPHLGFLNQKQIMGISENGDLKQALLNLLYAANKEGMDLYKVEPQNTNLIDSIHETGAYLKNNVLYDFR